MNFIKPKILLLDLPRSAYTVLTNNGFNVSIGTLGKPYKVEKSSSYEPLIGKWEIPFHTEQEIIVVDLSYNELENGPNGQKHVPDEELDFWGKCDKGFLDPRVRSSSQLIDDFDRTLSIGGVFVVFADAKTKIQIQLSKYSEYHRKFYDKQEFPFDVYCFLTELLDLKVQYNIGKEITSADQQSTLGRLLKDYLSDSRFTCSLEGGYRPEDGWNTLAINKFGEAVSICRCRSTKGSVIILPQIKDKAAFLDRLFTEVLPELAPHLFPDIEKGKWLHHNDYELPHVLELKEKQNDIIHKAKEAHNKLDEEIAKERDANGWINDLLTGTDAELVSAVKKALEYFGFTKVIDMDVERDREGKSRREDLQIHDQNPLLVVDIKGIAGVPCDTDALQADKHASIRIRELKKTDINGLSIINHQRHIPPLERNNEMPFRQEILDAADVQTLGLMTSWDLYRLFRNFRKFSWQSEHVKPIFYKKGRIDVVPIHYQYIGSIAKTWTDKFGIVMENGELHIGEKIAVEFPIEFEEVPVDSIQVNGKNVEQAQPGNQTGLLWPAGLPKTKERMRVFRIPK